jgi:hypothetical protein
MTTKTISAIAAKNQRKTLTNKFIIYGSQVSSFRYEKDNLFYLKPET